MKLGGVVRKVTKIKPVGHELDFCKILIDFDELYIFYSYSELEMFIDKSVIYETRKDIYEGKEIIVVACVSLVNSVQVLEPTEQSVLITGIDCKRSVCNFSVESLKIGDVAYNSTIFLAEAKPYASERAKWLELVAVDMYGKSFRMKLFTTNDVSDVSMEDRIATMLGHYIKCNIVNTRYGYQTEEIKYDNQPVLCPPEVEIAISQISKAAEEDDSLREYLERYNYIDRLKTVIYYELGYNLVEVAAEILLINALCNIAPIVDRQTLIRAAVCSRGYLMFSGDHSRSRVNTDAVLRVDSLKRDKELLMIIDVAAIKDWSPTKRMYIQIRKLRAEVMKERRGLIDEEDSSNAARATASLYAGLL